MFRRMVDKVVKHGKNMKDLVPEPVIDTVVFGVVPLVGNWYNYQLVKKEIAWDMELEWEQERAKSKMEEDFEAKAQWLLAKVAEREKQSEKERGIASQQHC